MQKEREGERDERERRGGSAPSDRPSPLRPPPPPLEAEEGGGGQICPPRCRSKPEPPFGGGVQRGERERERRVREREKREKKEREKLERENVERERGERVSGEGGPVGLSHA